MNKIHEECGAFAVYSQKRQNVVGTTYYGLFALQHRGQEACGVVVNDDGVFNTYKDEGLVSEVLTPSVMSKLGQGNMALGHVKYGVEGFGGRENAQPIVINHLFGSIAVAQNGSLVNGYDLRTDLESRGSIFYTKSDAEIIAQVIIRERLACGSIEDAVARAMPQLKGAISIVVMSPTKIIAARDEYGIRPMCFGKREDGSYIIASESCALDAVGATFVRDVLPGEIVIFGEDGVKSIADRCNKVKPALCVFEYIYFARPDSVINGLSVHDARVRAGISLAKTHPVDADVVIGVPDSGIDAAIGYAKGSGIPYELGFIKNKYIGRTFIVPGQKVREDMVRIKLNAVSAVVKGKRVVLVDDSIVRGTTSAKIVKLLREAGASEVHMRVSSPPFLNPCYYGTDIASKDFLIACHHTVDEIRKLIGVDTLGYLKAEFIDELKSEINPGFCTACFDGQYPTQAPSHKGKFKFETKLCERTEN